MRKRPKYTGRLYTRHMLAKEVARETRVPFIEVQAILDFADMIQKKRAMEGRTVMAGMLGRVGLVRVNNFYRIVFNARNDYRNLRMQMNKLTGGKSHDQKEKS